MSDPQEDWLLWQLADSALPTGGFVASSGLESAVHSGYVSDVASLSLFTSSSITNYAHSSLPFMTDSWKLGAAFIRYEVDLDGERMLTDLLKLDALCDACTTNIVSKRASKAQGVAMLTLFSKSFPFKLSKGKEMKGQKINLTIEKFKSEIRHGFSYGHLSVCFGIVTSFLELSLERAQHLFLFLFSRSILSAAVRLNIIGPYYSQRMLSQSRIDVKEALAETRHLDTENAMQTSPLLDILQGRHDKLYSRLFNS